MTLVIAAQWIAAASINGLEIRRMPVVTTNAISYAETMGIVMMNLGCATIIPTWVNIKAMHVRTQSVMWVTFVVTSLFYIVIGMFFALGFDTNPSNNSLQALLEEGTPLLLCRITVGLYSYVMLLPSVPVNCLVSCQNLVQNKIVKKPIAVFLAFVVPILVSVPLQTRNYLFVFLKWTSLIFVACANFLMPLIVYLKCVDFRHEFNQDRILTFHQLKLLAEIHHQSNEIGDYIMSRSQDFQDMPKRYHNHPAIVLTPAKSTAPTTPYGSEAGLSPVDIIEPQPLQYFGDPPSLNKSISEYSKISIRVPKKESSYPSLPPDLFVQPNSEPQKVVQPNQEYTKMIVKPSQTQASIQGYEYVNPMELGVDEHLFDEDVPDPDLEETEDDYEMVELNHHQEDFLSPRQESDDASSHKSGISSGASLPRDPRFKTPPFRAIPRWVPLQPTLISKALLAITTIISILNLLLNLLFPSPA
jgi:hypothetical protein